MLKQAGGPVTGLDTITGSHVKSRVYGTRNERKNSVENCRVKKNQFRKSGNIFVNGAKLISDMIQLEAIVSKLLISDECQINLTDYK
jgi:hypothetical protein